MEKYTVQDYYNYMKFNPEDEGVPQDFLDEYIKDVTNTDWFATHAEMISDFLDNMRMDKLSNINIEQESEVVKMAALLRLSNVQDRINHANIQQLKEITNTIEYTAYELSRAVSELDNNISDKREFVPTEKFDTELTFPDSKESEIVENLVSDLKFNIKNLENFIGIKTIVSAAAHTRMPSLLKLAKAEDIAFDATAHIRVWAGITDLEYEKEIDDIKKMSIPIEEKIRLGKDFAKSVAMKNLYERILDIRELGELQETYDRIDWVSLFETEE